MHDPAEDDSATHDDRHVAMPQRLATVTVLANMRHRHGRTRRPVPGAGHPRNTLSVWLLQCLAAAMEPGRRMRTTMPSVSDWAQLTIAADDAAHNYDGRGPRIDVTMVDTGHLAAIERACHTLADLQARPRLDAEVRCTPDHLVVTLRGILADPVMAPRTADSISEDLQADAGQNHWFLDVTEAGSLRWELHDSYTATLP